MKFFILFPVLFLVCENAFSLCLRREVGEPSFISSVNPYFVNHLKTCFQSDAWIWPDTEGKHINAHGGGFLYYNGTYYWYGEYKFPGFAEENAKGYLQIFPQDGIKSRGLAQGGISCYSSTNLMTWKNEGVVLHVVKNDRTDDLAYGGILERPKVVFNRKTKEFIMYFKLKLMEEDQKYAVHGSPMYYGVAVSDSPSGPFVYSHKYLVGPEGSGDFTLFEDDDGQVYLFCAKKPNHLMGFIKLDSNYMNTTGGFTPLDQNATEFEAPAVFKANGLYYVFGSGTKGYHPTVSRMAFAKNIDGPWTLVSAGYARGENKDITFGGQVTYVIPVNNKAETYIVAMDRWRPTHPYLASYLWLPLQFDENGIPFVEFMDRWALDDLGVN